MCKNSEKMCFAHVYVVYVVYKGFKIIMECVFEMVLIPRKYRIELHSRTLFESIELNNSIIVLYLFLLPSFLRIESE